MLGGCLRLSQVARGANNLRSVRYKGSDGLNPNAGGNSGHQNAPATQIHIRQYVFDRGCCAKCIGHAHSPL
jgi:hypothetical protein